MSAYTPREGSVAQRVMWYLEEHGASSTTTICDDVEDVTRQSLVGCLATAIAHGALFTEKRAGESWYSVKPFEAQEPDTPREGLQHVVKAEPARADATDRSPTHATPARAPAKPPSPAVAVREGGEAAKKVVVLTEQLPTRAVLDGRVVELSPEDAAVIDDCRQPILRAEYRNTEFVCALFSDGRLLFEFDGVPRLTLSKDQTRSLVHFLDRALHEELTA